MKINTALWFLKKIQEINAVSNNCIHLMNDFYHLIVKIVNEEIENNLFVCSEN